jgi:hypothetical protein
MVYYFQIWQTGKPTLLLHGAFFGVSWLWCKDVMGIFWPQTNIENVKLQAYNPYILNAFVRWNPNVDENAVQVQRPHRNQRENTKK